MESDLPPQRTRTDLACTLVDFAHRLMQQHRHLGGLAEAYIRSSCAVGMLCLAAPSSEDHAFSESRLIAIARHADGSKAGDACKTARELWDYAFKRCIPSKTRLPNMLDEDIIKACVEKTCIGRGTPFDWFPPEHVKIAVFNYWPFKPAFYMAREFKCSMFCPEYRIRADSALPSQHNPSIPRPLSDQNPCPTTEIQLNRAGGTSSTSQRRIAVVPGGNAYAPPPQRSRSSGLPPIPLEGVHSNLGPPQFGPHSGDVGAHMNFALPLSRPGLGEDSDSD